MIKIAPSILSADFSKLAEEIHLVEKAGADLIHVDVMDGHFVPNITIGQPVVKALSKATDLPLDVHLMIEHPDRYLKSFAEAGANIITIHPEANTDIKSALKTMEDLGVTLGLALKPATPIQQIKPYLKDLDVVMIMSVEPGFGGQTLLPGTLTKITELKKQFKGDIEIDGGINTNTIKDAVKAGANIIVAGNAIFGAKYPAKALKELKDLANDC
ncbi:ribulose-phosphate 3-epimerase [archaeon]|nr:ribulose-phosphate 3-epimerase [archaeon]